MIAFACHQYIIATAILVLAIRHHMLYICKANIMYFLRIWLLIWYWHDFIARDSRDSIYMFINALERVTGTIVLAIIVYMAKDTLLILQAAPL